MKFEFSAGGIVYKKEGGKFCFALILDPGKKWTFPKGKIEKKEKPEKAALRETEEELGVSDLKIMAPLGKIDYWFRQNDLIHKFVYFFLMQAPEKTYLKYQKAEILDAQWFEVKKAKDILFYKTDLPIFKKACQILEKLSV